jgi:dihydroxy-acid dehydratase
MGWSVADLAKPQILVESTFGDSHPGSAHLFGLVEKTVAAVAAAGGKAARYFATDICDGMAQGHDGINYSLASRDTIANLIEIHARATTFDGGVFLASCDKAMPAHLMAIGRLNIPAIVVTGGVMDAGPDLLTLEQIGTYSAKYERGEITADQFAFYKTHACPSCGACSFMGTASTMQIMAEALGLMLPGTALLSATSAALQTAAVDAGTTIMRLVAANTTSRDIVSAASFENAVMVHAAISGSTNALIHLPAIAREFGVTLDAATFDRLHRGAHYLLDIRPAGRWPAQYFSLAGGVPAVMEEIRSHLNLDVPTVTGATLGDNLDTLKSTGYYERCAAALTKSSDNSKSDQTSGVSDQTTTKVVRPVTRTDVIRTFDAPIGSDGTIAVLHGNLAPEGAVIKHSACPPAMFRATLVARPFDSEEAAIAAVLAHDIHPGDAVIIRYEGPKGSGMPEMFYTTEAIASDPDLAATIALITDGRFSGASKGPAIGHVSPEAARGGPIALVEPGDLIELDVTARTLNIVGTTGTKATPAELTATLAARKAAWKAPPPKYPTGVMSTFTQNATTPMLGAAMN